MEAIRAICYGDYNYNDDYIRFNGYGNIDSYTKAERDDEIKSCIDEIVDRLMEILWVYRNLWWRIIKFIRRGWRRRIRKK